LRTSLATHASFRNNCAYDSYSQPATATPDIPTSVRAPCERDQFLKPQLSPAPKVLRSPRRPPLQVIRGQHETFNRLVINESIHNLRDVRDCDASVKKVIGFD